MNKKRYVVDTNFFIAGFGKHPRLFKEFVSLFPEIEWVVSDYVFNELRWYLRSHIAPYLTVIEVDPDRLSLFERYARQKVKSIPQTPDMSCILLARDENLPIVSSDLKLVQVARKLGIPAQMNSAFLLELLQQPGLSEEQIERVKFHRDIILNEEIAHSVEQKDVYDPVIRIKAIMNSSLEVLRKQARQEVELDTTIDTPIELELSTYLTEIRKDFNKFLEEFEQGNFDMLEMELDFIARHIMDLMVELSIGLDHQRNQTYLEALTTLGYVLYLLIQTYLVSGKLDLAVKEMDKLAAVILESKAAFKELETEFHIQRIRVILLTEDFRRLEPYFTKEFFEKAFQVDQTYEYLLRVLTTTSVVLKNKQIEPTATAKDVTEVEFLLQLGYLFSVSKKLDNAFLILAQSAYIAINSDMVGMAIAAFEEMVPLYLSTRKEEFRKQLAQLEAHLIEAKSELKDFGLMKQVEAFDNPPQNLEKFLTKRAVKLSSVNLNLSTWMTILHHEQVKLVGRGKAALIVAVEWNTKLILGIIDQEMKIPFTVGFGSMIQLLDGKVKVSLPPKKLKTKYGLDLVVSLSMTHPPQLLLRNVGQAILSGSSLEKLEAYDL